MRDPLHFPSSSLIVSSARHSILLNKSLLDLKNAWGNLEEIMQAHELKLAIYELIEEETNEATLKSLAKDLTQIELELQSLWGFSQDTMFHKFWLYPKCTCPKMDNEDNYPNMNLKSSGCPLHGFNDGK